MSCPGAMCERCFGDGACERADLRTVAPTEAPDPPDLARMGRTELIREVKAHRLRWELLAAADRLRRDVHGAADAARDLPPSQTLPYIRANDVRLEAVKAAFSSDADVLRLLGCILTEWPAFQKSG